MIRITAGKYRGRKIFTGNALDARPATSIVRESIFNIMRSYVSIQGLYILDLFCGSGSLSFEALSRGAESSYMVDINYNNLQLVQKTAMALGVMDQVITVCCDVERLSAAIKKYDIVFIDPPYHDIKFVDISLNILTQFNWCKSGSIVTLRVRKGYQISVPEQYIFLDERVYGISKVIFLLYNT
ncbi:16S rRNA (guanine(966)-N(2))-methyltransferase RsmD [Neoehrlichia mikurensis]|uniref:16S rRNA (Guanine(966)-N(2))-methyltransferase RsmD n=1 Tax=Neoehrlichia mikurensis TaxID=89586 RepID=A0A9Q9BR71_9RICK|nr:16S rRNA (guanine(966)-N(2))-methyltransferase RsmD [Neoehrlichia mikurensis]QXK92201.1 16S rRNA (guanine(966)-N(2))-methyltransferase RsmD [Neoehrlichia mikurensis]QXK92657.1 16S rRNA (guanine(966)-N(2))-methyltransferase RsmD [Neoehrlichia mikurensis]QXK93894.1 16S rRNA (guanine(966)-N(2))-methyltransferase RsmD [Neoehrlichia mikurensis]UTO55107.1 16S rRNA (guanine(966)-N(2))-methyltransferase RsmD [Neoehrlichia mikurensis]UTO56026.1 16S rRNA (guanine(966)-N(2))-methyltransferase RsmD [Ne